ncbi:uncharacterized protein LOC62_02G002945 [Vanrija pseudolonga]|uniref:Ubiquitin-like domain-containing protein n=1 Tax=Vanrija pseudolonga TaxID=143232 RepID=A0AAF1BPH8_9TREE|nr:hypothetical protein LOC62_02G002945 [Vanrija pseudolonga]
MSSEIPVDQLAGLNLVDVPDFSNPITEAELAEFNAWTNEIFDTPMDSTQGTPLASVIDVRPAASVLDVRPSAAVLEVRPGSAALDVNPSASRYTSSSARRGRGRVPSSHPYARSHNDLLADTDARIACAVDFTRIRRAKCKHHPQRALNPDRDPGPRGYFKIALRGLDGEMQPTSVRVWVRPRTDAGDIKAYLRDSFGYDPDIVSLSHNDAALHDDDSILSRGIKKGDPINVMITISVGPTSMPPATSDRYTGFGSPPAEEWASMPGRGVAAVVGQVPKYI